MFAQVYRLQPVVKDYLKDLESYKGEHDFIKMIKSLDLHITELMAPTTNYDQLQPCFLQILKDLKLENKGYPAFQDWHGQPFDHIARHVIAYDYREFLQANNSQ